MLAAFLRALALVGLSEAVCYRLLPDPVASASSSFAHTIHVSLSRAGGLAFFLAFFFVTLALCNVAYRALQDPLWPPGHNGVLALCLLCLALFGFSALILERGPLFAALYTCLSTVTLLLIGMNAFVTTRSTSVKVLAVCYGAATICSASSTLSSTLAGMMPGPLTRPVLAAGAVAAGHAILVVAAGAAFIALTPWGLPTRRPFGTLGPIAAGTLTACGFTAGVLLAPDRMAFLGGRTAPLTMLALSWVIFLGTVCVVTNLMQPHRRMRAYGILLVMLAGYPLRIAHQQMMAALGAVLLFSSIDEVPESVERAPAPTGLFP